MHGVRLRRSRAVGVATCVVAFAGALRCEAGTVEVTVKDEHGEPLGNVAVYATPIAPVAAKPRTATKHTAVMDQKHNEFVPSVLIVSAGTDVLFPNSDNVSHHVYSFSQAKTFELGLYKGNVYPPVTFDQPGVVVIGCNIHDSMLGYIVVVPSEHYAMSDARGAARLEGLPAGEYTVDVWTPRARPMGLPAAQRVTVADGGTKIDARITGRLAPEPGHDHGSKSLSWDRY
jgi:plastocyanin